jgi:hypothetical protein
MTESLTSAVRAALRYQGVGNLSALREAAGFSGHAFANVRRGQRRISPSAARRLARVFATWARACAMRADRITQALSNRQVLAEAKDRNVTSTNEEE